MTMLARCVAVVVLVGGVASAQNAGKRPMTFADLQAMKRVSDPQISPSGKWVLFSVTDVSLEKNTKTNHLWAVALSGGAETQVTSGTGESNGRFSPDGKWVMYSSAEGGSSQIWVAPWDDAAGKMAAGHVVTGLETEADGAVWAPDSKHFLFVSNVYPECESKAARGVARNEEEQNCNALKDAVAAKNPVKALVFEHLLYRHWNAYVGAKHSHIFYASVEQGAPEDLTPGSVIGDHEAPTFSLGGPMGYAISPDGKEVAYVTNLDKVPAASTNNDVFVLQVGAEPSTARKVSTSAGSDDGPAYSPDGKWLAWRSQKRNGFESDQFKLMVMDRSAGLPEAVDIRLWNPPTAKFTGWVDEFVWSPDSAFIVFASAIEGEEAVFAVDIFSDLKGVHPAFIRTTLHGEYGDLRLVKIDHSEKRREGVRKLLPTTTLVATRMLVDQPAEIVTTNLGGIGHTMYDVISNEKILEPSRDDDTYLTHLNGPVISALSLSPLEPFWFTGAAGTKVEGFIVKPPNFDPGKKYPVKFLMHGGPQTAWGDSWSYRWNWELLAANGYVVVGINRRGSTGYGQKFVDEVSGDWGGKAFVDLMKGLDYAEAKYSFIDKSRECALGASYGGFMANWVLTHTDRFKCIVTHDGMYNPQSAYGSTEEMWFNEWEFRPVVAAGPAPAKGNRDGAKDATVRGEKQGAGMVEETPARGNRYGAKDATVRDEKRGGGMVEQTPARGNRDGAKDATVRDEKRGGGMVEQTKPAQPWDYFGATNENDPFRKWSPMLHIKAAHTPTLVVHSQRDYRLDVSEGFQLFSALQRLGVPSKMLYFPDEGHWVLKPQNSQLWYETVNDWCDRWLGVGKYEGQETVNRKQKTVKAKGK